MSNQHHGKGEEGLRRGGGESGLEKAASEVLPQGQVKRVEEEVGKPLANVALEGIVGTIQDLLEPGKSGKKAGRHGGGQSGEHKSH